MSVPLRFMYLLHVLITLIACDCVCCLGRENGLSRQQVWRHSREYGIATAEDLNAGPLEVQGLPPDELYDDLYGGDDSPPESSDDDDGGRGNEDDDARDDDEIDWADDPFYHKVKPYLEDLLLEGNTL